MWTRGVWRRGAWRAGRAAVSAGGKRESRALVAAAYALAAGGLAAAVGGGVEWNARGEGARASRL